MLSWVAIIAGSVSNFQLGPQVTIVKSLRIARLLFFVKGNRTLKTTLTTFLVTLPALINVGGLLILLIMLYSILGVYLFAEVKLNGALDVHANF